MLSFEFTSFKKSINMLFSIINTLEERCGMFKKLAIFQLIDGGLVVKQGNYTITVYNSSIEASDKCFWLQEFIGIINQPFVINTIEINDECTLAKLINSKNYYIVGITTPTIEMIPKDIDFSDIKTYKDVQFSRQEVVSLLSCVPKESNRMFFKAVYFDFNDRKVNVLTTDGKQMIIYNTECSDEIADELKIEKIMIESKMFSALLKSSNDDFSCRFYLKYEDKKCYSIQAKDFLIQSEVYAEGNFVPYEVVLNKILYTEYKEYEVNTKAFYQGLVAYIENFKNQYKEITKSKICKIDISTVLSFDAQSHKIIFSADNNEAVSGVLKMNACHLIEYNGINSFDNIKVNTEMLTKFFKNNQDKETLFLRIRDHQNLIRVETQEFDYLVMPMMAS